MIVDQLTLATMVVYVAGEIDLLAESSLGDHLTDLFVLPAGWSANPAIVVSPVRFGVRPLPMSVGPLGQRPLVLTTPA